MEHAVTLINSGVDPTKLLYTLDYLICKERLFSTSTYRVVVFFTNEDFCTVTIETFMLRFSYELKHDVKLHTAKINAIS